MRWGWLETKLHVRSPGKWKKLPEGFSFCTSLSWAGLWGGR